MVSVSVTHQTTRDGLRWAAIWFAALLMLGMFSFARAASAGAASVGMQFSSHDYNDDSEEWAVLGHSGAQIFRVPFTPGDSENGNNFGYYDRVFELAAKQGVTILPNVGGRMNNEVGLPSSGEQAGWTEWIQKGFRRYGYNGLFWQQHPELPYRPAIAWEIWNEPNNAAISGTTITASQFGSFIKWAGPAIQSTSQSYGGQSTGVVMGGLLAWSTQTNWQTYLSSAYAAAGPSSITGIAFHPYELDTSLFPGKSRLQALKDVVSQTRSFVSGLQSGAGAAESLWITEYGWPAQREYSVSEQEQASLLKESVSWLQGQAAALNLHSILWYNYRDTSFDNTWAYRSGLRDEVGNYRRSWFAFEEAVGAPRWPIATTAIQANTGTLWLSQRNGGGGNTGVPMKAGTSPSIGQYNGSYKVAFQGTNGNLWYYTPATGAVNTGLGMASGTSPSITALQNGMIAFQGNNGNLWYFQTGGPVVDTGYGMKPKSSPSISWDPKRNRYPIGFQANTGELWIYEPGGFVGTTGLGMAPETSPTIAAVDGRSNEPNFTIAFQANTGQMWLYQNGGTVASTAWG